MEELEQPTWIEQITAFIGEYIRSNSDYSPGVFKEILMPEILYQI